MIVLEGGDGDASARITEILRAHGLTVTTVETVDDALRSADGEGAELVVLESSALHRERARGAVLRRRLVSMLVHDFRTPLSTIMISLELVRDAATGLSEEDREDLSFALSATRSLADMLSTIGEIAGLETGASAASPVRVDLTDLVRDTIADGWGGAEQPRVVMDEGPPLAALCDPDLTRRVVRQLVVAAAGATPDSQPPVRVRLAAHGDRVRVEVDDGALTIPPELQEALFDVEEMFEIRENHRTLWRGAAPAFCRLAIEAQDGEVGIRAEGDPGGRGNTVWFELPRAS